MYTTYRDNQQNILSIKFATGIVGKAEGGGEGGVPAVLGDELYNLRAYNNRNVSWES